MPRSDSAFARLQDEVVAVNPRKVELLQTNLLAVANHPRMAELQASHDDADFWYPAGHWAESYRPYLVNGDGVLMIPVKGVLLANFPWAMGDWATGYQYIAKAIERGQDDANVRGIAAIVDSCGGEVRECFECAEKILAARADKPIRAFIADHGYSAAYALACAADDISMSKTAGVGSIGVITIHFDFSAQLAQDGVKATIIESGKFKSDGSPLKPLSAHAKERTQNRIDEAAAVFFEHVAKARPNLTKATVKGYEGATFSSAEALDNGLGDQVESHENALVAFSQLCSNPNTGDDQMKINEQTAPVALTDADVSSARADGMVVGIKQGRVDEKARITAIMSHEEAKDRQGAAFELATSSDLDADAVAKILAKLPKDVAKTEVKPVDPKTPKAKTAFEKAMEVDNPEVGAGADDEPEANADAAATNRINAAHDKATGKVKKAA